MKGLLFDLDGVIVSTERNHFEAWRKTAQQLGIEFTERDNEMLKGVSRIDSLRKILALGKQMVSDTEFEELLTYKNDHYLSSVTKLNQKDLLPGVLELLNAAQKLHMGIGLGSSSKNAPFILDLMGITHFFDVIVDGNQVQQPKPHPEVFLKGAASLGLEPSQCLVFEDAESGVQAAKAGGFTAIGVGNDNIRAFCDVFVQDLTYFNLNEYA
jgi:beta-phosphoglucomutase